MAGFQKNSNAKIKRVNVTSVTLEDFFSWTLHRKNKMQAGFSLFFFHLLTMETTDRNKTLIRNSQG